MHPFLKSPRSVFLMGLLWSPIVLCLILLEGGLYGLSFLESLILVGPSMVLELSVALSLWYPCKTISGRKYNVIRFVVGHGVLAAVSISVWLLCSGLYSEALDALTRSPGIWRDHFDASFLLFAGTGLFLYFVFCLIYSLVLTTEKARQAQKMALKNSLDASRAELLSLKTAIHPHFLFNSMTALSTLTLTSPEKAHQMCIQLSDFLRYSLDYGKQELVKVRDEMEHIENYLEIEKIRLGDRLVLDFQIDVEALEVKLPPFTLLPLVENAIKHAFQQSLETRTLYLRIQRIPEWLLINVQNSYDPESRTTQEGGYGLKGLKKRLAHVYSDRSTLVVRKDENIFSVSLRFPVKKDE